MKLLCKINLLFFLAFLAAPTIISVLNKEANIASFYNMTEEEENGYDFQFDEIKIVCQTISEFFFPHLEYTFQEFTLQNDAIICNYSASIFIPPPDLFLKKEV
ncbi:hypothetical protein [Flavobacterium sp. J27]|uniref:hypothetical protein n=1 Tax=Flavobacterium sp. J27 TaxID=2060419 RepID=UPI00102FDF3F|nr:hypothetical protein [Flavobacterium sp. J27]